MIIEMKIIIKILFLLIIKKLKIWIIKTIIMKKLKIKMRILKIILIIIIN